MDGSHSEFDRMIRLPFIIADKEHVFSMVAYKIVEILTQNSWN